MPTRPLTNSASSTAARRSGRRPPPVDRLRVLRQSRPSSAARALRARAGCRATTSACSRRMPSAVVLAAARPRQPVVRQLLDRHHVQALVVDLEQAPIGTVQPLLAPRRAGSRRCARAAPGRGCARRAPRAGRTGARPAARRPSSTLSGCGRQRARRSRAGGARPGSAARRRLDISIASIGHQRRSNCSPCLYSELNGHPA